MKTISPQSLSFIFIAFVFLSGCSTNPKKLKMPDSPTCIDIQSPIEFKDGNKVTNWISRLERGPYWSEKVDKDGTYYRAPIGGVSKYRPKLKTPNVRNGGVYVPFDETKPIYLYKYMSGVNVKSVLPPEDLNCNTFVKEDLEVDKHKINKYTDVSVLAHGLAAGATDADALSVVKATDGSIFNSDGATILVGGGLGVAAVLIRKERLGHIDVLHRIKNKKFTKQFRELVKEQQYLNALQVRNILKLEKDIEKTKRILWCKQPKAKGAKKCIRLRAELKKEANAVQK